jgi:hypothetical protein
MTQPAETVEYLLTKARLEMRRNQQAQAEATLRGILAQDPACDEAASMLAALQPAGPAVMPAPVTDAPTNATVIERLGSNWPILGWALFAVWFLGPYVAGQAAPLVFLGGLALWLLWWIIDVVDQRPTWWHVAIGVVMLAIGILPRGGLLMIAAWVIYWTRVRE